MSEVIIRQRSKWFNYAHSAFSRIPDAGRTELDFRSIPQFFSNWFYSYGVHKFAHLRPLDPTKKHLYIRMYVRFMDEYREILKKKFAWLHYVKFTKMMSFTVDPHRFFHLHDEFKAVVAGWHKMAAWLRKKYGPFFYMRVLEFQKSGRPHLHILAVLPEYVDYGKMHELWDKKYDIGVQCQFDDIRENKKGDGLSYVLKYVTKSIVNASESTENIYSSLLFASNMRLFSMSDVRRAMDQDPGVRLDIKDPRATATFEYAGSICESFLKPYFEGGVVPDRFVLDEDVSVDGRSYDGG